jgi:hypothetical protein
VDSARWTISVNGGAEPRWSRDGRQLFFRTPAGDMMAVQVAQGSAFLPSTPVKLFNNPHLLADGFHRSYDVSGDERFIMIRSSEKNAQALGVVINWGAEITRAPAKQ